MNGISAAFWARCICWVSCAGARGRARCRSPIAAGSSPPAPAPSDGRDGRGRWRTRRSRLRDERARPRRSASVSDPRTAGRSGGPASLALSGVDLDGARDVLHDREHHGPQLVRGSAACRRSPDGLSARDGGRSVEQVGVAALAAVLRRFVCEVRRARPSRARPGLLRRPPPASSSRNIDSRGPRSRRPGGAIDGADAAPVASDPGARPAPPPIIAACRRAGTRSSPRGPSPAPPRPTG